MVGTVSTARMHTGACKLVAGNDACTWTCGCTRFGYLGWANKLHAVSTRSFTKRKATELGLLLRLCWSLMALPH